MSEQHNMTDNTVNDQQHEEVDYADPESPTLAIRQLASPTTGPNERLTDVVETNDNADTADTVLPGGVTTLATTPTRHRLYPLRLQPRNETAKFQTTMR